MIDLPNSFERYLSSLRFYISLSIIKYGLQKRHIKNLRKIYLCEAFYNKNTLSAVDIKKLTINILNATSNILPNIKYSAKLNGNFFINKNLYTLLLLKIIQKSPIVVFENNNYICIKFSGEIKNLSPIISALNGFILTERKSKYTLIIIPSKRTKENSIYIESEWEYLFDTFSIVNLIIKPYSE